MNIETMKEEHNNWLNIAFANKEAYKSPRITSEFPDCSMPMTFDTMSRCSYSCAYCFSWCFKSNNPACRNKELTLKAVSFAKFRNLFEGKDPKDPYYRYFIKDRRLMQWGGLADPFDKFEQRYRVSRDIITYLGDIKYPCKFSFKGDTVKEYLPIFDKFKSQKNFAFQSSIITLDEDLASKIELGVPSPLKRYEMLKELKKMGYYTIHRLRPFLVGCSDRTLNDMLAKDKEVGIDAISMEFYALDLRINEEQRNRYKWMSDLLGYDMIKYYKQLSPSSRGTYMRLNRKVKEKWVKKIYKFCLDNNVLFSCSDPDFKELNMSPSCCGMPNEYPDNPEMTNYSKTQLTNLLRTVRQKVWRNGGNNNFDIHFEDMMNLDKIWDFYYSGDLYFKDMVEAISRSAGKTAQTNFIKKMRMKWNDVNSGSNISIYTNGKLFPTGYDDNRNMTYRYRIHPYERRWIDEGIRLDI